MRLYLLYPHSTSSCTLLIKFHILNLIKSILQRCYASPTTPYVLLFTPLLLQKSKIIYLCTYLSYTQFFNTAVSPFVSLLVFHPCSYILCLSKSLTLSFSCTFLMRLRVLNSVKSILQHLYPLFFTPFCTMFSYIYVPTCVRVIFNVYSILKLFFTLSTIMLQNLPFHLHVPVVIEK